MQVVNLDVLLTDDLVLPLCLVDCFAVLLGLALSLLQLVEQSVLLFLLVHDCDLEVVLHFPFLVELGLLGI